MKRGRKSGTPLDLGAQMTFGDIGRELGITAQHAHMLYKSGLRKLAKKKAVHEIRGLALMKEWEG